MLFANPASGLICPCTTRFGSWQARHIWAFELSRTRNICATVSMPCTCGLWQLVHSMLQLMSFTAPVGSAVLHCPTSEATRSGESLSGSTKLKGCDPVSVVPNESTLFMAPTIGNGPYAADCPTPTV